MNNSLLASPVGGIFWLLALFIICFFGVHIARLAHIGWIHRESQKNSSDPSRRHDPPKPPEPKQSNTKQPESKPPESRPAPPEPVYYIVERKRRRPKANYSEPKEIKFK